MAHFTELQIAALVEETRVIFDTRSQERYINKSMLNGAELSAELDRLPDLAEAVQKTELVQPALGLFDEETLARIQRAFPY